MKDTDYLAVSTYVRVLSARLPNHARPATGGGGGQGEMSWAETLDDIARRLPRPELVELFRIPTDYHNVKALLRCVALKERADHLLLPGGRFSPDELDRAIPAGDLGEFPAPFQAAIPPAWAALAERKSPQEADFLLDRACYEELSTAAAATGSDFVQRSLMLRIDSIDLRTFVRCHRLHAAALLPHALLPGGTVAVEGNLRARPEDLPRLFARSPLEEAARLAGSLCVGGSPGLNGLERTCREAVDGFFARGFSIPFGPEPVCAYLWARQREGYFRGKEGRQRHAG